MLEPAFAQVTRPTFWQIGSLGKIVFYGLAILAILVFAFGLYRRVQAYAQGSSTADDRLDHLVERIATAARIAFSNEKNFNRDLYGGLMHAFILWGFLTLFIGTTILFIDMDFVQLIWGAEASYWEGDFYLGYAFVMDSMGLLFVIGIAMAIYRRYWVRNHRLWGRHTSLEDDAFILVLLGLGVGGFLQRGLGIVGREFPDHEAVGFVGWAAARLMDGAGLSAELAQTLYPFLWWSHALLALAFIAWIPFAKPWHMVASFSNVVAHDVSAGQRLPGVPADLEVTNADSIQDFTWKELLDQDACTKCGRCSAVCPAKASGRPLDPRDVILDLKAYRESRDAGAEAQPIIADGGGVIEKETMDSCMACMACMDACPVDIEHLTSFTRMQRQLMDEGEVDPNVQDVLQGVMQRGNTFGEMPADRADWADDLNVEVTDAREEPVEFLWYVGDFPSYDDRNKRVARSLARLFEAAGVDWGILFDDEQYDGNDIRRIGEEFLYVDLAGHHVETFEDCEFEAIVCTDPHSFNTIKNEYPEVDFADFAEDPMMSFEYDGTWNADGAVAVHHWTQVIEELVAEGRLGLDGTELEYTVTYHDPCHLGRFNDEYEAPRALIEATGCELYEMPRNRANSFCCGGGGGGVWMEFDEDPKPSEERLREALEDTDAGSNVEKFVVACPQCTTMYEDGRKTGGFEDDIEVVDVAELLIEALEGDGGQVDAATAD